jgi:hypothetical protein
LRQTMTAPTQNVCVGIMSFSNEDTKERKWVLY